MGKKFLLLYAGPNYEGDRAYQSGDMQKVVNCGATDYVILTNEAFNYLTTGGSPILTTTWVNNNIVAGNNITENNSAASCESTRQDIFKALNKAPTDKSYADFVQAGIKLAKMVLAASSTAKIWFGLPRMVTAAAASLYVDPYQDNVIAPVKRGLTTAEWNRLEGFYFCQEDMSASLTKFNRNSPSTCFDNVAAKTFKTVADTIHNTYGKKTLWIPYYKDTTGDQTATRVGCMVNLKCGGSNVIDIAMLQPMFYFHGSDCTDSGDGSSNLTLVKNCVAANACKYFSGKVVPSTTSTSPSAVKTSNTTVGFEMEIDSDVSKPDYASRYAKYASTFSSYYNGSAPYAFYVGSRASFLQSIVYNRVKNFFTKGTNSTAG